MTIDLIGRPLKEAASFLEENGYTVKVVCYSAPRVNEQANERTVLRCRIDGDTAELLVSVFQTEIQE